MVFSSAVFLFYFLPAVLLLYFLARGSLKIQNLILFGSSFVFYFWGEKQYTILVLASVLFNYLMGIAISKTRKPVSMWVLGFSIIANLLVLFYYKYFGFFIANLQWFTDEAVLEGASKGIHLPLGISFFTFHGLTYVIDIYRRDAQVSHNPLNVGLYTLFFPQLVAGPIVRYKDIDQQLTKRSVNYSGIAEGTRRFIIGFAKKMIIANAAGEVADNIYSLQPNHMHASLLWVAAIAYSIQIYFDFSGYSDMAIGLARMFGFKFLENFNFPYAAQSIKDFWRRWHISLSTFFRDYVYIPLGGNKKGSLRTYVNLIAVFFLTGIWHGASWNFVIWGLYHGFFLIMERLFLDKLLSRIPAIFRRFYTLFIVCVGWVFFRVENFGMLKHILKKMFLVESGYLDVYRVGYFLQPYYAAALIAGIVFSFPVHQYLKVRTGITTSRPAVRITYDIAFLALFFLSLSIMASSTFNPFIYFRF